MADCFPIRAGHMPAPAMVGGMCASEKTAPRWTNKMAHPQIDNHARQQTRRGEQGHTSAEAARARIEKLADVRQRKTEVAWKIGVDARTWLLPFAAWMRAGEAAWLPYAQAWSLGEHGSEPLVEPAWTTRNSIRLELASMRVREFSSAETSKPATLILAPFALHGATIADFAPGHSIVETLQHAGVSPLRLVECKSATPSMRFFSIDTYLAELNVVIDALGGTVNLVGLCQGGWLSLIYAAQFPAKVNSLVLAGSPIDLDAAPSRLVQATRTMDPNTVEQIVHSGQGRVLGQAVLDFRGFWGVRDLDPLTVAEILQTEPHRVSRRRFG